MDIYILKGNSTIRLPVLPESFEVQTKQNHSQIEIISIGEINLKGKRGLKTISFSSFYPSKEEKQGYKRRRSWQDPLPILNKIEAWKDKAEVVRIIITETNINSEYLIQNFNYGIKDGSGDWEYTIELSEYVRPKILVKNGNKSALYSSRDTKNPPETYTVKSGDTLKSISKKLLGKSSRYTEIAKINKIPSPYTLRPGQVLVIKS